VASSSTEGASKIFFWAPWLSDQVHSPITEFDGKAQMSHSSRCAPIIVS